MNFLNVDTTGPCEQPAGSLRLMFCMTDATRATRRASMNVSKTMAGGEHVDGDMDAEMSICRVSNKEGTKGQSIEIFTNMAKIVAEEEAIAVYVYAVYFDTWETKDIKGRVIEVIGRSIGRCYSYNGVYLYVAGKLEKPVVMLRVRHPDDCTRNVSVRIMYRTKSTISECAGLLKNLLMSLPLQLGCKPFHRLAYDPYSRRRLPNSDVNVYGAYRVRLAQAETPLLAFVDAVHVFKRHRTIVKVFESMERGTENREEKLIKYCLGRTITCYDRNDVEYVSDVTFSINYGVLKPTLWTRRRSLQQKSITGRWKTEIVSVDPSKYAVTVTRNGYQPCISDKRKVSSYTRISPDIRVKCIQRFLNTVQASDACKKLLSPWKIHLRPDLISLQARVLPLPRVFFKDNITSESSKLFWDPKREPPSRKFLKSIPFKNWRIFCAKTDVRLADKLASSIGYEGEKYGVEVRRGKIISVSLKDHPHYTSAFSSAMISEISSHTVQFVIVILPQLDGQEMKNIYGRLKQVCMAEYPTVSQMVNSRTLQCKVKDEFGWDQVVGSLISNITCKLGGILWSIPMPFTERIMFVGLDVWHGDPYRKYSVGAIVCSLSSDMSQMYSAAIRHRFKQEIFSDITSKFSEALEVYRKINNQLPDRIIIYRDGVNRVWYNHVLQQELRQFMTAVESVFKGTRPLLSLVVVQKRIYERFFVRNGKGVTVNAPPGTVVDHTVTRARCYDFYLCTMYRVKGTAVPTHYIMLYDNSGMTPDVFQEVTHAMCYSYCNWPGSFYVPSVVQYAHKLAGCVGKCGGAVPDDSLSTQLHFL